MCDMTKKYHLKCNADFVPTDGSVTLKNGLVDCFLNIPGHHYILIIIYYIIYIKNLQCSYVGYNVKFRAT